MKSLLDDRVPRIKIGCTSIGIDGIGDLVIAGLVKTAEIVPNFADVWVEADGTGISIKSISILVDLIVQHTDGAPEGGVSSVAVHSLLISLVCFVVPLSSHESAAKKVPALSIIAV